MFPLGREGARLTSDLFYRNRRISVQLVGSGLELFPSTSRMSRNPPDAAAVVSFSKFFGRCVVMPHPLLSIYVPLLSLDSPPILASYTSYAGFDYCVSPQASLSLSATFVSFLPLQLSSFSLVCSFCTNSDSRSHPVPLPHTPFEYRSHRIVGS